MVSRFHRLLAGVITAGLVLLLAPVPGYASETVSPTLEVPAGPRLGVQFHGMWSSYDDAERALFLDQLVTSGATWVRLDVGWTMLQPTSRDSFDMQWGVPFVDRVIDMVTSRGLTPLVTLWLTPDWANGGAGSRVLPDDPEDYARAARWAADRWSDQVPAWEVWNEPNLEHFMEGADPTAYTRLLQTAAPAIHAGNPHAKVVFGGPSSNDTEWLAEAYAAGAKDYFDIMATHPYQGMADEPPEVPANGSPYRFTHLKAVHELMVRNGDGEKPIWATEFGWSTHPNIGDERPWERGVTETQQGDYLIRALQLVEAEMPYVTHMFWYTDRDYETSSRQNGTYGLFYNDLRPKPAFHMVKSYLTSRLSPLQQVVAPPGPDVSVTVDASSAGGSGDASRHTVEVANLSSTAAASVTVEVTVPAGHVVSSVTSPPASNWACVMDGTGFMCSAAGSLPPETTAAAIDFEVQRSGTSTEGTSVNATVRAPGDVDSGNDEDNDILS